MTCSTNSEGGPPERDGSRLRGGWRRGGWRRGTQVGDGLLQVVELLRLAGELRCHRVVAHRTLAVASRRLMPAVAVWTSLATAPARGPSYQGSRDSSAGRVPVASSSAVPLGSARSSAAGRWQDPLPAGGAGPGGPPVAVRPAVGRDVMLADQAGDVLDEAGLVQAGAEQLTFPITSGVTYNATLSATYRNWTSPANPSTGSFLCAEHSAGRGRAGAGLHVPAAAPERGEV